MKIKSIISLIFSAVIAVSVCPDIPAETVVESSEKLIALTFDDGPNTYTTPKVLDLLEDYDARASFFLIGKNINNDSAKVMKRAHEMGCEIDSHSKTHSDMSAMSAEEIKAEMAYVDEYVYSVIGEYPKFFRAPYLNVSQTMYDSINLPFITGFSSGDSNAEKTAQERAETVLSSAKDGAIILMHDFYGNDKTVEALKIILPELKSQGYEFVTLSELFERKGETPVRNFCYSEVQRHICNEYTFSENLFTGEVSGDNKWEGWKTAILLNDADLDSIESDFTIEVSYDSIAPPVIVLHRWKSSEDNLWQAVKPAYYNGTKACFRSEDMQAVLNSYGMTYADMNYIMVRTNWTEMTITQVDLLVMDEETSLTGDVNLDRKFNIADLVELQKWLLSNPESELKCWQNGDVCADGRLDAFDLCVMRSELIKIIM
ncbi:MAG: polysaccharide deacetylase family protein [Ruminococcus sp.]|nr:polysaccharide deacetylase family protein [Ruminococcus sp.]